MNMIPIRCKKKIILSTNTTRDMRFLSYAMFTNVYCNSTIYSRLEHLHCFDYRNYFNDREAKPANMARP